MATYQYQTRNVPRAGMLAPLNIQPPVSRANSLMRLSDPGSVSTDKGVTDAQVAMAIESLSLPQVSAVDKEGQSALGAVWKRDITAYRLRMTFSAPVAIIAIPINSNVSGMPAQVSFGSNFIYKDQYIKAMNDVVLGYIQSQSSYNGYIYLFACMDARPTFNMNGGSLSYMGQVASQGCYAQTSAAWIDPFDIGGSAIDYNPENLPRVGEGNILQVNDFSNDSYSYGSNYIFLSDLQKKFKTINVDNTIHYEQIIGNVIDTTYYYRKRFSDEVMSAFDLMFSDEYKDVFSSLHVFIKFARGRGSISTPWSGIDRIPNEIIDTNASEYISPILSTSIVSGFPVFNIQNVEGIYNYFKNGDTSGSENPDLELSEIDLKTDWTVYVKGNRNPDILVTMKSPALEEFLADPKKNKKNWTKEDFICEYRVPSFVSRGAQGNPSYTGEYKTRPSLVYNQNNGPFSWLNNIEMGIEVGPSSGPLAETSALSSQRIIELGQEYSIYAQMQFRIKYWSSFVKGYNSSWCGYNLGYFGSPDIKEFAPQNNWGDVIQGEYDDGSTVTIIYDELPGDTDGDDKYKPPLVDTDPDITSGSTLPPNSVIDTGLNLLTTSYKISDGALQELGHDLWADTFIENIKMLNNSPIENIVGVKIMPVALSGHNEPITIGNVTMNINGDRISETPIIDCGSFNFEGYYKSFLDFAPFTSAFLFLPFIGFVEIDANMFTGHTLNIKYSFDIVMGQCRAMLFTDGIYAESYDAVCGIDVPLVASNRAQIETSSIGSFIENPKDGVSIANFAGVINHLTRQSPDTWGFRPVHARRSGGYTSVLSFAETRQIFLILSIPQSNEPSNYAHTVGLPCSTTWNLSNLSGFTITSDDVDLRGFSCTDAEKEEIHNLLTTGVYL